ncbi:chloride channel protein [Neisseria chenwenguii]|uniref:chloride channel protein n=1 Tax=Neisseria chenwenguii TaxID=1853278 RepID=UPI0011CDFBA6|nr:chloride channel protein [Neisseria chenwenguii]
MAPREMSAAFASLWVHRFGLDADEAKLLLACASGAGLAAVYNVPMAGVLFTLEVMLCAWDKKSVAAALPASVTATAVARYGLGDAVQYHLPQAFLNTPLLVCPALAGPPVGAVATVFVRSTKHLPFLPRDNARIGKAGNQLGFAGMLDGSGGPALFAAK